MVYSLNNSQLITIIAFNLYWFPAVATLGNNNLVIISLNDEFLNIFIRSDELTWSNLRQPKVLSAPEKKSNFLRFFGDKCHQLPSVITFEIAQKVF